MQANACRIHSALERRDELSTGAGVQAEALLVDPGGDGARQEGLACVIDVPACESVAESPGALAEVSLVEDVERGTVLGQEVCHGDACDVDNSVMSTSR